MTKISRRFVIAGIGSGTLLTACGNGVGSSGAATIDARVDKALNYLFTNYPATTQLRDNSVGMLVMPFVTEAGLFFGGSFGQGALRVGGVTVDYYSATAASYGLQIGAQQYSHVLFFMTDAALAEFRRSNGWVAGADLQYAVNNNAENISTSTTVLSQPVIPVVFGQAGLIAGATIEGTKYTRIIP